MFLISSTKVVSLVILYACFYPHAHAKNEEHCHKDGECPHLKATDQEELKGLIQTLLQKAQKFPTLLEGVEEILKIRDEIFRIQGTERTDHLPRRKSLYEAVENLNNWAKTAYNVDGVKGVVVEEFNGLGLVAARDIKVKETIIEIPVQNVIASQHGSDPFECLGSIKPKVSQYPGLWKSANLSMIVLSEARNESGRFRTYMDALPNSFVHPSYFNSDDFELLKPSMVYETTVFTACEILGMYATLWLKLDEHPTCAKSLNLHHPNFPLNAFLWAYTISLTRNYDGSFHNGENNKVVIPFWDLANHNDKQNVETHNMPIGKKARKSDGKYSTFAERDIKAGEPILMHYLTPLDPVESFATWGFVHMAGYALKIRLDPRSSLYDEQIKILDAADWQEGLFLPNPDHLNGSRLLDYHNKKAMGILVELANGRSNVEFTPRVVATGWKFLMDQIDVRISSYAYSPQYLMAKRFDEPNEVKKTIFTELIEELLILQRLRAYVEYVLQS